VHAAGPLAAAVDSQSKHTSATAAMMYATDASSAIPGIDMPLRELHGVESAKIQRSMGLAWRQPRGRMMHPTRDAVFGVSSSRAPSEGPSSTQLVDAMMELMPAQRPRRRLAAPDGAPVGFAGAPRAATRRTLSAMTVAAAQNAAELPLSAENLEHGGGTSAGSPTADAAGRTRKRPRGGGLGRWSPSPSLAGPGKPQRRFNFGSRSPAAVRAHVHRRVRRLTPSTVGPFLDRFVRWLHGDAGWRSPLQRDAALANACAKDHVSQFVIMPTGYGKTLAALLPALLKQKAAVMATASDLFAVQEGSGHAPRGHCDRTTAPQASARGPLPFTRGSADPGNRSVRI